MQEKMNVGRLNNRQGLRAGKLPAPLNLLSIPKYEWESTRSSSQYQEISADRHLTTHQIQSQRLDRILNIFIRFFTYFPMKLYKHLQVVRTSSFFMMRIKRSLALSLSIVLLLTMGLIPVSLASHSLDHHHHSAQTHTTGICAWMCTAAQTISTDAHIFSPNLSLLEVLPSSRLSSLRSLSQLFLPSRAPPF